MFSSRLIRICWRIDYSIRHRCLTMQSSVWFNNCRLNAVTIQWVKWKRCLRMWSNLSRQWRNSGTQCVMAMTSLMMFNLMLRYWPVAIGLSKKRLHAPFRLSWRRSRPSSVSSTLTSSRIERSCGSIITDTLCSNRNIWRRSINYNLTCSRQACSLCLTITTNWL